MLSPLSSVLFSSFSVFSVAGQGIVLVLSCRVVLILFLFVLLANVEWGGASGNKEARRQQFAKGKKQSKPKVLSNTPHVVRHT